MNRDDASDNDSSDSDSDSDNSDKIQISDGLSSSTLSALLEFMNPPPSMDFENHDTLDSLPAPPNDGTGKISDKSVVAAYTPNDVNVIAETFARLQARAEAEEIENPKVCVQVVIFKHVQLNSTQLSVCSYCLTYHFICILYYTIIFNYSR